jgi:hypothetical protein
LVAALSAVTPDTLTTAAAGYIDDVVSAVESASNPTQLSSTLSGIVSAASSLPDADAVESAASVGQSSFEDWYYGGLNTMSDPIEEDMDDCLAGQYENQSYELDDITYICMNNSWHQARSSGLEQRPLQLYKVAFSTRVASCSLDWQSVAVADGIAAMTSILAQVSSGYWFFAPQAAAAEVAVFSAGVSAAVGWDRVVDYIRCTFNLS